MKDQRIWPLLEPERLRRELQDGDDADLARRRGVIVLSLLGIASMAVPEARRGWSHLGR